MRNYMPPTRKQIEQERLDHRYELYSLCVRAKEALGSGRYDGVRMDLYNAEEAKIVAEYLDKILPAWRTGLVARTWLFGEASE